MGCFDSVFILCPKCGYSIELQSKGGECGCLTYTNSKVPVDVAQAMDGDLEFCPKCEQTFKVVVDLPIYCKISLELHEEHDND